MAQRIRLAAILAAGLALLPSACSTEIDPINPAADRYYSLFGFVHDRADTHWVRIAALQVADPAAPLGVEVVLEHPASGRRVSLRDSLFRYDGGAWAHNFAAVIAVAPGETYRLVVAGPGGTVSTATTTLPDTMPPPGLSSTPVIFAPCPPSYTPPPMDVSLHGVDPLVEIEAVYYVRQGAGVERRVVSYLQDVRRTRQGEGVQIPWGRDVGPCPVNLERFELILYAGSRDWPPYARLGAETKFLPTAGTNVIHGTGYFGGVVSRTFAVPLQFASSPRTIPLTAGAPPRIQTQDVRYGDPTTRHARPPARRDQ